jgi:hypothetical protein
MNASMTNSGVLEDVRQNNEILDDLAVDRLSTRQLIDVLWPWTPSKCGDMINPDKRT